MGNELTILNNQGIGVDFTNPLFKLKPSTLNIVQPNTQLDAKKGALRINETGDQYDQMVVTLLKMPTASRRWYTGQAGQLNRIPENLMCYSYDLIAPDKNSKIPQAMNCASCSKNMDVHKNWEKWSQTKNSLDRPQCETEFLAYFIDTVFKFPFRMFIRSKAKDPFEIAMSNLTNKLFMRKAQGLSYNIFDVKFTMGTKEITTGKFKSYVPTFSKFEYVTDEDRVAFGDIYQQFVASETAAKETKQLAAASEATIEANSQVDNAVTEGEYVTDQDGDIII